LRGILNETPWPKGQGFSRARRLRRIASASLRAPFIPRLKSLGFSGRSHKGSASLLMPSSRGQHFNEGIIFAQLGLNTLNPHRTLFLLTTKVTTILKPSKVDLSASSRFILLSRNWECFHTGIHRVIKVDSEWI